MLIIVSTLYNFNSKLTHPLFPYSTHMSSSSLLQKDPKHRSLHKIMHPSAPPTSPPRPTSPANPHLSKLASEEKKKKKGRIRSLSHDNIQLAMQNYPYMSTFPGYCETSARSFHIWYHGMIINIVVNAICTQLAT